MISDQVYGQDLCWLINNVDYKVVLGYVNSSIIDLTWPPAKAAANVTCVT